MFAVILVLWSALAGYSFAQSAPTSEAPQSVVVLTKLSDLIYPPLALTARIQGDAEVTIRIRQDGTVDSVEPVRGHPMLIQAALDSAKQSHFECRNCSEAVTQYSLVYSFKLTDKPCCAATDTISEQDQPGAQLHTGVTQLQNHITILAHPSCICDPSADVIKVRSAKCFYLWKCSRR